ncbi:hypothetical protein Rs2_02051 [Raphanus sativus]|nr:hypothetical protein Rs2_02051 [Raphanus sativus]
MEVAFSFSPPTTKSMDDEQRLTEMSMKLSEDFTNKLGFSEEGEEIRNLRDLGANSKIPSSSTMKRKQFSFACVNAEGSPITAEEAFEDGQIRPVFPLFNRDLLLFDQNDVVSATDDSDSESVRPRLRKVFVEDGEGKKAEEGSLVGAHCSWSSGTVAEASPRLAGRATRRDSRSSGDLGISNAAVGDKTQSSSSRPAKLTSEDEKKSTKTKKGKEKTTSSASAKKTKSAHEKLYMRNRALKEEVKHRSYLPYKQVGFFTNVNGLSRNIHPF